MTKPVKNIKKEHVMNKTKRNANRNNKHIDIKMINNRDKIKTDNRNNADLTLILPEIIKNVFNKDEIIKNSIK